MTTHDRVRFGPAGDAGPSGLVRTGGSELLQHLAARRRERRARRVLLSAFRAWAAPVREDGGR